MRPGQVEPLLRPGDPDVGQPPLLGQLLRIAHRPHVREHAVLPAGEEHHRELQALGRVQGHQGDHARVVVGHRVGVGDQRHPLQERGQRTGRRRADLDIGVIQVGHRRVARELPRDRDELGQVVQPRRVLRILAGLQLGRVAGARVDGLEELGGLGAALDQLLEPFEDVDERRDAPLRPGGHPGDALGLPQRRRERDPLALRPARDQLLRLVADAALGHVEDAPQADRVLGVGQHPQVGQRIAHLAPLVEPHAADHLVRQPDPQEHVLEHP